MAWQCICEGAGGLVFCSWFDVKKNPDVTFEAQWAYLRDIAAEIAGAVPMLLSVEEAPRVGVAAMPASPEWLHWIVRRQGEKAVLFAVNDGDAEGTISVTLPPGWRAGPRSADVPGPATTPDGFRDRLPRLDVRAYPLERMDTKR